MGNSLGSRQGVEEEVIANAINQPLTNPIQDSSLSKLDKLGVEIRLQDFAISIESKPPLPIPFLQKPVTKPFFIVNPFSTVVPGSSLFAILGGSGSGKTTLLNVLAGRFDSSAYKVHGSVSFSQPNCSIGYVTQADFLLPSLTVRETLTFTAKLKISPTNLTKLLYNVDISSPQDVSYERLVENVVMDLGLKECADSLIGVDALVDGKRGISGGEKRRVSVGLQILTDPEVLCADEPTSGLDSFTAITLMESLKRLTKQSRKTTVICSIHQPRADVFNIFDAVLILSKGGNAIYCGPTKDMIGYFAKIGYECPSHANPADFFVDLSSVDVEDGPEREESVERVKKLIKQFKEDNASQWNLIASEPVSGSVKLPREAGYSAKLYEQYFLLLQRFLVNNYRDSSHFYGGLAQALIVGFIICGIFWQLGDSQADVSSREGLMYIDISMENYLTMIIFVERYCREIKILDRELQDELYHPVMYLLAHVTSTTPQMLLQPFLFSIPIYFGCNLRPGINNFLMFTAVNIILCFVINGLVWMCLSIQRLFSLASLIANLNFTFISLTAGFLVNFNTMPVYVSWVQNISFLSYAYRILMSNEFTDRTFGDCSEGSTSCISGNAVLDSDGVTQNDYYSTWPAIILIGFAYYAVAAILLTVLRFPPTGSVSVEINVIEEDSIIESGDKETFNVLNGANGHESKKDISSKRHSTSNNTFNRNEIEIRVENVNLFVQVPPNKKYVDGKKKILKNIHVKMEPGKLIALMGGSGSGKTTLLNLIANRIPHGSLRRSDPTVNANEGVWKKTKSAMTSESNAYFGSGEILFNGKRPSSKDVRYSIGYVPQFDYHLPSLTVLETLSYQAKLRLPVGATEEELHDRVNEVLKTMGLVQCGGVQVGNEEKKGISGGEKRRLSIGIQLLSDPSICLFDEPTTGLDAFTARHIVQTLKSLAVVDSSTKSPSKKRTVILSIHQPRYDIFALVDEVTLLSRGDIVWSGGVKEMLEHFNRLGHACPALVNPADFILDLSSIDFRSLEREEQTRATLANLVQGYEERRTNLTTGDIESSLPSLTIIPSDFKEEDEEESNFPNSGTPNANYHQPLPTNDYEEKEVGNEEEEQNVLVSSSKPNYISFPLLLHRSFTNLSRQPDLFYSRISQPLFFALILACFYAPVGDDQQYIQNRIGNLYELTATCFIGMLNCIDIFPTERNLFYREYLDGIYSSYAFIVSFLVIAIPINAVGSFFMSLLMTYAVGLKQEVSAIFAFTYCVFSFALVGECLGVIFCSAFSHVGFSLNLVSAVISFFTIMAGFFSSSMPQFLIDINYISPMYWGAYILANIGFEGETFTCDQESIDNGSCLTTGDEVLELYNFGGRDGKYGLTFHYWIVAVLVCIYFMIAVLAVRLRAYKISH